MEHRGCQEGMVRLVHFFGYVVDGVMISKTFESPSISIILLTDVALTFLFFLRRSYGQQLGFGLVPLVLVRG